MAEQAPPLAEQTPLLAEQTPLLLRPDDIRVNIRVNIRVDFRVVFKVDGKEKSGKKKRKELDLVVSQADHNSDLQVGRRRKRRRRRGVQGNYHHFGRKSRNLEKNIKKRF